MDNIHDHSEYIALEKNGCCGCNVPDLRTLVRPQNRLYSRQGGVGRNPPPDAPHLVGTSPEIESLRPKSPPQKSQQQQTNSVSQPAANSTSKKASATSPGPAQNSQPSAVATSVGASAQEVQASNASGPVPTLPASEMARAGSSVPITEQRPVPVLPSSSRTSSMATRTGLEVDGSTEEEKFLDAGTPGNLDSQK